jgi:hypothetical protein
MADKTFKGKISAKGTEITVLSRGTPDDYLSLTDIARYKNPFEPKDVVANWMRLRNTIEYLGIWEQLNDPEFKGSNSTPFCAKPAQTLSRCRRNGGLTRRELSASYRAAVAAARMRPMENAAHLAVGRREWSAKHEARFV